MRDWLAGQRKRRRRTAERSARGRREGGTCLCPLIQHPPVAVAKTELVLPGASTYGNLPPELVFTGFASVGQQLLGRRHLQRLPRRRAEGARHEHRRHRARLSITEHHRAPARRAEVGCHASACVLSSVLVQYRVCACSVAWNVPVNA